MEIGQLRSLVLARLNQRFPPEHSEKMADVVMFGELAGRPSHGVLRVLPGSFGAMDEEPNGDPVVERISPAAARVTGRPGMLVASVATDLVIDLATEHGFAVVTSRGSRSTSGSLSYFVERMAEAGLVSFVSANTLAIVTVPGARDRVLGTNPLAIGIPADGWPLILDMGTAAITFGEVVTAAGSGAALPEGVAVDKEGRMTTNAKAVMDAGALLPFGGHKGVGLAMMVEALNRVLSAPGIDEDGALIDWGHVFVAFALEMLGDATEMRARAAAELDRLSETETVDGSTVRIPGQGTLNTRDEALTRGTVEVDDESLALLVELVGPID